MHVLCAELLIGSGGLVPDGRFLVKQRPGVADEYVLSVTYRGKPTHHRVTVNDSGIYLVNGKVLLPSASSIDQVHTIPWFT